MGREEAKHGFQTSIKGSFDLLLKLLAKGNKLSFLFSKVNIDYHSNQIEEANRKIKSQAGVNKEQIKEVKKEINKALTEIIRVENIVEEFKSSADERVRYLMKVESDHSNSSEHDEIEGTNSATSESQSIVELLRAEIEGISKKDIKKIKIVGSTVNTVIKRMKGINRGLDTELADIKEEIRKMNKGLTQVNQEILNHKQSIEEAKKSIKDLTLELQKVSQDLTEEIDELSVQIKEVSNKLDHLAEELRKEMKEEFDSVKADNQTKYDGLKGSLESLRNRVDNMQKTMDNQSKDIGLLRSDHDRFGKNQTLMLTMMASLTEKQGISIPKELEEEKKYSSAPSKASRSEHNTPSHSNQTQLSSPGESYNDEAQYQEPVRKR